MSNEVRKLSSDEQKLIAQMIADTNSFRLAPQYQKIFNGIRTDFERQTANGSLAYLSEKQITAIKSSYRTSINVQAKLEKPSNTDIECKINIYTNPISR